MTEAIPEGGASAARRLLTVVVRGNPRRSERAAEGLRIASGIAGWRELDVAVVLQGEALSWWEARQKEAAGVAGGEEPGSDLEADGARVVVAWALAARTLAMSDTVLVF